MRGPTREKRTGQPMGGTARPPIIAMLWSSTLQLTHRTATPAHRPMLPFQPMRRTRAKRDRTMGLSRLSLVLYPKRGAHFARKQPCEGALCKEPAEGAALHRG